MSRFSAGRKVRVDGHWQLVMMIQPSGLSSVRLCPFSVLNARGGWWQERKAAWLALGIQSELGRGDNMLAMSDAANAQMTGRANAMPGGCF